MAPCAESVEPSQILAASVRGSFGPTAALLGQVDLTDPNDTQGTALKWTASGVGVQKTVTVPAGPVDICVTVNPALGAT